MCAPRVSAQAGGVKKVVIDAGHGGKDPGNLGTRRYKTREKDIALSVALKTGKFIQENLPDVEVIYTRKTDVFVELQERAAIANRADADLFISIHCDAFTKSDVHGATCLVMGKNHGDDNLRVAMNENAVIYLEDNYEENYGGFDPKRPESYIALTLYQGAFMNQSVSFAQKVQDQFRTRVQRRDRGVKQQPLMVTKMAVMPAVLVELGFLTNPTEEDFLNSEKGQDYMASAIYRAFKEYKSEMESFELTTPAPELDKANVPVSDNKKEEFLKTENITTATANTTLGNDIPNAETAENEAFYTVQIVTSGRNKELTPGNFNGVEGVWLYKESGLFKYVVGKSTDLESAEILKLKMRERGFEDAFVIALQNGKRITLSEAREQLQ